MNRRFLWCGIGAAFALAVGAGYVPDLMLANQMRAARAEGLIQPPEKPPSVPVSKNARLAYQDALRKEAIGMTQLRNDPAGQFAHPSRFFVRLLRTFEEASKRPLYVVPRQSDENVYGYGRRMYPNTDRDLSLVALALAQTAPSEERLLAAARMARHLQNDDPLGIPAPEWGDVANGVLDRADALRLPAAARARVVAALGRPDPAGRARRHVVAVLTELESKRDRSARMARAEMRFLLFWRGFLRAAPRDPAAFAQAVRASQAKMIEADNGVGVGYEVYRTSSMAPRAWTDWADGLVRALRRM